jgi:hypothetical protein
LDYAGKIKFGQNVINFSNATGTSTVVIGDPIYEDNQLIPNRFIENIYANLVTFFDTDLDKNKRLLSSNPELADFLYVDDREVLREKVLRIRKDFNFRKSICDQQLELVRFDKDAFYNDLMEVFSKDVKIKEVKQEAPKKKLLEY